MPGILKTCLYSGFIMTLFSACNRQQGPLQLSDTHPHRNQSFTITYDPSAQGAEIPDTVSQLNIQFTYGNLYELPYVLPMKKQGKLWQASFDLPRYVTFATFIFKSGSFTDQPSDTAHYELYIYDGKKPVENTYLYRAYSLPAQMGNSDSTTIRQAEMYRKELELYPDNYEAKLRLLNYKMHTGTAEESAAAHKTAMALIDQKFHSDPTFGGNLNKVTMGYLIIGENTRLDSVREVVMQSYPKSALAKEYLASKIQDEPDPEKRKALLLESLKDKNAENASGYAQHYAMLFDYYLDHGDAEQSRIYAGLVVQDTSPYKVQTLQETAEKLAGHDLLLEEALNYVRQAYQHVEDYPLGIIRYFPETGYIPSFVEDKPAKIDGVRGDLKALEGSILDKLGRKEEALSAMQVAAEKATEKKTLMQVARYFQEHQDPKAAFSLYKNIYLESPMDADVQVNLRKSFEAIPGQEDDFASLLQQLDAEWKGKMKQELRGTMIQRDLPDMKQLQDLQGNPVDMNKLKGKVLVIDFWATWCVPCLASFPYMEKVYQRYKDREDLTFLIVNTGANNTLEDAVKWKSTVDYTFPVYYNADPEMLSDFGVRMIPASFVVDSQGQIRFATSGFEGEIMEAKLGLMLDLLLEK